MSRFLAIWAVSVSAMLALLAVSFGLAQFIMWTGPWGIPAVMLGLTTIGAAAYHLGTRHL